MSRTFSISSALSARYPWVSGPFIVSAPMTILAGPKLAVEVSRAGGLGFIGPGSETQDMNKNLEDASSLLRKAREATPRFNVKTVTSPFLPVGVGFLVWKDDQDVAITMIEKFKPCAVWLYAPKNHNDLDNWSQRIRDASPQTQIWIQIGTVSEAKRIMESRHLPVVVVVQGSESGCHGRINDGMGLISLFPEVADAMAGSQIPLLAAGGIADGRGLAAVMGLGASGVVMGTRFLASQEARIHQSYQDEIIRTSEAAVSTTRTLLYKHLKGQYGWPEPYVPRTITNQSFFEHKNGRPFKELQILYNESFESKDGGYGPNGRRGAYVGASIGLIHNVKHASDIVRDIQQEALERIHLLWSDSSKE